MKCLNCLNFVTAHTFLTGWYLFTFFTVVPFWCTPLVILDFCFIFFASNTVIWSSLVGTHRSKLEVEDFIFHVVVFPRETWKLGFKNLRKKFWRFLSFWPDPNQLETKLNKNATQAFCFGLKFWPQLKINETPNFSQTSSL